jgi:citrate synthase
MSGTTWNTSITRVKPNELLLRGYRIDKLMGSVGFSQVIYLALVGRLPTDAEAALINAILVSSIDHGTTPPSALATRTAASTGAPLNAAVAAGVLSINRFHGGAIFDCMGMLLEGLDEYKKNDTELSEIAKAIVERHRAEKVRIPGLGHRIHSDDPRTVRLFSLADELKLSADGVALIQEIAQYFRSLGKALPINVDGAIAALLVDLDIPQALANAFFIISRVPGLIAHYHEEISRERPMRRIHPDDCTYDGPVEREL